MRSAIASASWKWRRRRLPALAPDASLDDIARQAGVGAGTLYRHFPTRDALIEAVYRSEVEKMAAAERKFAETMPPLDALRAWMLLFVDHIAAKQIIAPALNSVVGGPSKLYEGSRGLIQASDEGAGKARHSKSGDIRSRSRPLRSAASAHRRLAM
jgi:AcrR family transcriptional regulator